MEQDSVQKAGGIITRTHPTDGVQLYLIHRPRHDDWSFPKGHIDAGEHLEEAALREVEEETGFRCTVVGELPVYEYEVPDKHHAELHFYVMHVVEDTGTSDEEADEGRWVSVDEALELISYDSLLNYLEEVRANLV